MDRQHVQQRWAEVAVALFFLLIGAAVIWDSLRVGMQWGDDGPQPGYFPFYIGLLLVLGAFKVLFDVVRQWKRESMTDAFATHEEIGLVLKMFIPTVFYVAVIFVLGLYVASALFGLFQGGIIPMYAVIVREYFPGSKAGSYIGLVIMATVLGMGFGGWMSGAIFDLTGSYAMAFLNGLIFNLVNLVIVVALLMRSGGVFAVYHQRSMKHI